MRAFLLLLSLSTLALLPACTIYGGHAISDHWASATGGEDLERSFWQDVKNKDWNQLEGHLAVNYTAVTPQGSLDRPQAMESLKRLNLTDYSLANVQTELHGNVFVVSYEVTISGTKDDRGFVSQPARMMTVWQQQKRGWVAIARSELGP